MEVASTTSRATDCCTGSSGAAASVSGVEEPFTFFVRSFDGKTLSLEGHAQQLVSTILVQMCERLAHPGRRSCARLAGAVYLVCGGRPMNPNATLQEAGVGPLSVVQPCGRLRSTTVPSAYRVAECCCALRTALQVGDAAAVRKHATLLHDEMCADKEPLRYLQHAGQLQRLQLPQMLPHVLDVVSGSDADQLPCVLLRGCADRLAAMMQRSDAAAAVTADQDVGPPTSAASLLLLAVSTAVELAVPRHARVFEKATSQLLSLNAGEDGAALLAVLGTGPICHTFSAAAAPMLERLAEAMRAHLNSTCEALRAYRGRAVWLRETELRRATAMLWAGLLRWLVPRGCAAQVLTRDLLLQLVCSARMVTAAVAGVYEAAAAAASISSAPGASPPDWSWAKAMLEDKGKYVYYAMQGAYCIAVATLAQRCCGAAPQDPLSQHGEGLLSELRGVAALPAFRGCLSASVVGRGGPLWEVLEDEVIRDAIPLSVKRGVLQALAAEAKEACAARAAAAAATPTGLFALLVRPIARGRAASGEGEGAMEAIGSLAIDRGTLMASSVQQLMALQPAELNRELEVTFLEEDGVGEGVAREWMTLLAAQLFAPDAGLFQGCPDDPRSLFPAWHCVLDDTSSAHMQAAGRLVGLALVLGVPLGLRPAPFFFKALSGLPLGLPDLAAADPEVHRSCCALLAMAGTDALGLTFVASTQWLGRQLEVPLADGGAAIAVCDGNKRDYVERLAAYLLNRTARQVSLFRCGLRDTFGAAACALRLFTPRSFADALGGCGGEDLDVSDWQAHTAAEGWEGARSGGAAAGGVKRAAGGGMPQVLQWLWQWLAGVSGTQRRQLLQFWTGLATLPAGGFGGLSTRLQVLALPYPQHRYPKAHTCFYQLLLPSYPTQLELQEGLLTALAHHQGYGLV